MKSQSNVYPSMIQKLDRNTYAFNYNVVEKEKEATENEEASIYYEYEQIIVNNSTINEDDVIRNTILEYWDNNQQLKLINDYFSYQLGLLTDDKYKQRYEDFLQFRATFKSELLTTAAL